MKVELLDQSTEESIGGLLAGKIDVALVVRPPLKHGSGLVFEKLVELPIGIMCRTLIRLLDSTPSGWNRLCVNGWFLMSAEATRTITTGSPVSLNRRE